MPFKDPEKNKKYCKQYYRNHQKYLKKYAKKYRLNHKKQCDAYNKEYYATHKEQHRRYYLIHKERYNENETRFRKKRPELEKARKAKRRELGFVSLNQPFEGSEGHHIDFELVVYIPHELHKSVFHCIWTGRGMSEINDKVFEWLEKEGGSPN